MLCASTYKAVHWLVSAQNLKKEDALLCPVIQPQDLGYEHMCMSAHSELV